MKAISSQIIIGSIGSRKDRSLRISFETPELEPEEQLVWLHLQGKNVKALFEPTEGSEEVVEVKAEIDQKTASQRLRGVLWRLQEQKLGRKPLASEFKEYYENWMDVCIERLKEGLE